MQPRRLKRAEKIISDVFDGTTIVLDLSDGVYFELNETGSEIWKLIPPHHLEPVGLDQITERICGLLGDEARPELLRVVDDFVRDLEQNHLLCTVPA